ncbi:27485_t:CDS:2 [Gigaspora margarita]|uniref:27485_t:CDS:1 n=1 Tax=Gigaspora margarita TaxID=4874 RepID=A0ABN7V5C4_GIGMA|nr:27485_t:CDS:2 [Gigaspora margarita]
MSQNIPRLFRNIYEISKGLRRCGSDKSCEKYTSHALDSIGLKDKYGNFTQIPSVQRFCQFLCHPPPDSLDPLGR